MRILFVLATLGATWACDNHALEVTSPLAPAYSTAVRQSNQTTARALAGALANSEHRRAILDALRASPYTEHRLAMTHLLRQPGSAALVSELSARLGLDAPALLKTMAETDIVVPLRSDRLKWRGSANYAVGDLQEYEGAGRILVHTKSGERAISLGQEHPEVVQILLTLAEPKIRRLPSPPTREVRPTIESPEETTMGGLLIYTDVDGTEIAVQLADIVEPSIGPLSECYENCEGGGGGGGSAPPDTTFLYSFEIFDGDCSGWADPTFEATYYRNGVIEATGKLVYSEVPSNQVFTPVTPLIFERVHFGANEQITLTVTERDNAFCGGDDHWGSADWLYEDRNTSKDIESSGSVKAAAKLSWQP